MDNYLPFDIYHIIFEYSDFLTKIKIRQIDKYLYTNLYITDMYNIEEKYLKLLSNDILNCHPFLIKLNASFSDKITDINNLKKLKVLNANVECYCDSGSFICIQENNIYDECIYCNITDENIKELKN
jgi:hypothetical protein